MTPPPGLPQLPAEIENLIRSRCCSCAGCANKLHGPGHYGTDDSCKADVILDMLAARERRVRETALEDAAKVVDAQFQWLARMFGTNNKLVRAAAEMRELGKIAAAIRALPSSPERQG